MAAALAMEWLRFVREKVWRDAGFGSLRKIRHLIEDFEPWFEPTVIPLSPGWQEQEEEEGPTSRKELPLPDPPAHKYPSARYYSVDDYHRLYLSGQLTPLDVAKALLPLIRRDTTPPGDHSIAWFDTKVSLVLQAAEESTLRYKEKRPLGPLDGIPTGVKDEYDIEGYTTNLGSVNDYTGSITDSGTTTSWCVRQLQSAGAIILGKLSMHEFGLDTTGNNPNYGTPPNPYNKTYYPGGSSSGTGYAVSAGLIPVGLGSDGGGSIRIPSGMCSVFGLKPTAGRVSFRPGQNHSVTCAVLGPIACDIRSLATVFQTISTPHPSSPFPPFRPTYSSSPFSSPSDRPKLLGVPQDWIERSSPAIQSLFSTFLSRLVTEKGYTLLPITLPFLQPGQTAHALTVLTDAATLLPPQTTSSLTAANRILLAIGSVTPSTDYLLAQKLRRLLACHLAHLWQQHPGMVIATPTFSLPGWPVVGGKAELQWGVSDGDRTLQSMEYVWLANFCGLPSISVPMGFVSPGGEAVEVEKGERLEGMVPVGLMGTGEWCDEEGLLMFGVDAEDVGADRRVRPPVWTDVVERAREVGKQREEE